MSKHTPWPWEPRGTFLGKDFGIVVEGKFVIAEVFSDIRQEEHKDVEEARANARLIAAAPDLLEALKQCLRRIDDGYAYSPEHAVSIARAAISKATGE